jgi:RNA 3'-phosphate cyclase
MKVIDGSKGEGGGSILRMASSLALVSQEPVKIINIRKKRPKPGLSTQHLMGLHALAQFCGGELEGAQFGSESVIFRPSNDWTSNLKIHVSTAGSIGLILQIFQLAILATKNHNLTIEFNGGATFGKWAPSVPYVEHVTWAIFELMNCQYKLTIERHGFFPKGGAHVIANLISPSSLQGLHLDDYKKPKTAKVFSYASQHLDKAHVAERQSTAILNLLQKADIESETYNEIVKASNPGSGVLIVSKIDNNVIGGDFVGERKLRAEKVGHNAFKRYFKTLENHCTVDPFLADQIIPVMGLASSSSSFSTPYLSNHTLTNIVLLKDLMDINVESNEDNNRSIISVDV